MIPVTDFTKTSFSQDRKINLLLVMIIFISTIIRGFFAWTLELGNDEVYYWTYALYPDLSHFDHPPMVGFTIQVFSWNLHFSSELFIRLGSVILGGFNTWLIFLIGKSVKDRLTGLFAALLYSSSVYCFVITGIFILPDTPQLFFWLISLYIFIRILPTEKPSKTQRYALFFVGIPLGFAMLSKYTSVFLWFGAGLYILFYNRKWLKTNELYLSVLLSLIIFSPVLFWNIENKFISFTFQSERVSFFGSGLRPDYFFTELLGQILYNNPVNFLIIIISLFALIRNKIVINSHKL
nr:glycosyltransferase family 39 protein [Bacteroidota bacterium]